MKKVSIVLGAPGTHGPSLIRLELAAELMRRGIEVSVILGEDAHGLAQNVPQGCEVHILGTQRLRNFISKLRDFLKAEQPDGVLASSWPFSAATVIAVKLYSLTTPVVISEHSDFRTGIERSAEFTPKDKFLLKYVSKYIYNRAHRIVGVSQGVIDGLIAVAGVNERKTIVISNPVRNFKADPPEKPEERHLRESFWADATVKLLAVGRIVAEKDYEIMVEALSILKEKGNFKLIIVGDGRLRAAVQSKIELLGLEKAILLAGESYSVSQYYDNADLFLMSSSSEGFGNVLVEALSFGLPIVSTDCQSGPAEILANGRYGILTPVGDAAAFAAGIEQALSTRIDPETQKDRAAFFSIETAADGYLSALFQNQNLTD